MERMMEVVILVVVILATRDTGLVETPVVVRRKLVVEEIGPGVAVVEETGREV